VTFLPVAQININALALGAHTKLKSFRVETKPSKFLSPLWPNKNLQGWSLFQEGDQRAASKSEFISSEEIMCVGSKDLGLHLFAIKS
jgi:hypothetical protein